MNIPQNLAKIKEAFSVDQVNQMLMEGWRLIAITQRAGAVGPAYTMGWTTAETQPRRQSLQASVRGIDQR